MPLTLEPLASCNRYGASIAAGQSKKAPETLPGAKATSLKTISKPTRAGQLDACAQRQSDGLADSLARAKTAPAKKVAPKPWGAWGRRTATGGKCPNRPHSDYARPIGRSSGASIRPARRFIIG
jgi:hypothetical protein